MPFFLNTFIFSSVARLYEAKYPNASKQYDIGILLGGFSNFNSKNNEVEFNAAGDRLSQTIRLYEQGVIQKILVSGGNASLFVQGAKEADLAIDYLKKIGVPDSVMLVENQSRNTRENMVNSHNMITKTFPTAKVLVITSAWHIPRTQLIAYKQGWSQLEFYPTNHISSLSYSWYDYIIPSASVLSKWEMLIKEWIGYLSVWIS